MLKLKVLLTKMAEMLKTLNDNKVDNHDAQIYINKNDTEQSIDGKLYEQLQKTNSTAIVNNEGFFSIKNMFTRVFKVATTSSYIPVGTYCHVATSYWDTTTNKYKENIGGHWTLIKTGNVMHFDLDLYKTSGYLNSETVFVIPEDCAPDTDRSISVIGQKQDGKVVLYKGTVERKGTNNNYSRIKIPANFTDTDKKFTRVVCVGSWIV